jgi:IS4 transposase
LLSQLDEKGIRVILPMRNSDKRLKEMEAIDASQFTRRFEGRRLADVFTYLKDYPDPLRFLVLKAKEDGKTKYVGFITNDVNTTPRALLKIYRKRWRIENLFSECDFPGKHEPQCHHS